MIFGECSSPKGIGCQKTATPTGFESNGWGRSSKRNQQLLKSISECIPKWEHSNALWTYDIFYDIIYDIINYIVYDIIAFQQLPLNRRSNYKKLLHQITESSPQRLTPSPSPTGSPPSPLALSRLDISSDWFNHHPKYITSKYDISGSPNMLITLIW